MFSKLNLGKKTSSFGLRIAEIVSNFVGTWTFVGLYTSSMVLWIVLHLLGVLHIDGPDFIKWNLWLSYFAGTQASLVLMSSAHQTSIDRKKQAENFEVDEETLHVSQRNLQQMLQLLLQMQEMEHTIDELTERLENECTDDSTR